MLKINRAYLDACGYVDGVFEELLIKPVGEDLQPTHHIIHAPNGVGKTTILALLFSTFEPDRRKFLRTEINRQHKIEDYFMNGRLGVVALELVKPGVNDIPVRHVVGQVFWLTSASKGDGDEPGYRRFFGFESNDDLSLDTLPFRGLTSGTPLRSLDDFSRWAREMRVAHPTFFSTDSLTAWRRFLTDGVGIDLKLIEVQRRFCAAEGGIGANFLDFKTEQQFLEKIFSFMIPPSTAEGVVAALDTALAKIRGLPQRKDQLKVLSHLSSAFEPFFKAAAELQKAEAEREQDFQNLGRLFSRLKLEKAKLEIEGNTIAGEIILKGQALDDARKRLRTLQGEILFLEKTAADRRIKDAEAAVTRTKAQLETATRTARAARAADFRRKLSSAEQEQKHLEAELERIERDLAPDRAQLARAGANLHGHLERLALESEKDASEREATASVLQEEVAQQQKKATDATNRSHLLRAEIEQLSGRVAEHDKEHKELERMGACKGLELATDATARLAAELTAADDAAAALALEDEQLETEARTLEGTRTAALARSHSAEVESERLGRMAAAGRKLEGAILASVVLPSILAGDASNPYRLDLPERVRTARAACEDARRKLKNVHERIAGELAFLDAEGVSSVPEDVALVTHALKAAGIADAVPAEHYLAQFKPDAKQALALLRSDPARFSGVFVSRLDHDRLSALTKENELKLKGPVVVSQATLEAATSHDAHGIVFGPFSAARVNKLAAAEEKAHLSAALAEEERKLASSGEQLGALSTLIENLRELHALYGEVHADQLQRQSDNLRREQESADTEAKAASKRQNEIVGQRTKLRTRSDDAAKRIGRLKGWIQHLEQFAKRYATIGAAVERIPVAGAERREEESIASKAGIAAETARNEANACHTQAVSLRQRAAGHRGEKIHYPETDGGAADRSGTLEDLRSRYKSAEYVLASKRDAQQATVSSRLNEIKINLIKLAAESHAASAGLTERDFEPFAAVADLERAMAEAELAQQGARDAVTRAEASLSSATSALGPVSGKIKRAEEREKLTPVEVAELAQVPAEVCDAEVAKREQLVSSLEADVRALDRAHKGLEVSRTEISGKLTAVNGQLKNAEGHLPDANREELPDLSLSDAELENILDQLVKRLGQAIAAIQKLERRADESFEAVRVLIEEEGFRRLEPKVADNLRRFNARSAGSERASLGARLNERIAVVQSEIDNQVRDQNACLDQLRLYVLHADDLLRRAVRCSKIPDHVPVYGKERILKVKRRLNDLSQEAIRNQLSIWLDEQVVMARSPKDGATLAAELLSRAHGGRPLDIEILKPKRDAIEPYMRVDRMGLSNGEGVTLAMMLYTVIQKMAMDERADGKNAASGGFLMLDNTYGTSNLMEHIVLQKTMADLLDIQLFVTTCVEDKHVLNMFPTITRLVQGERMYRDGAAQYIRVRSGDYLLREADHAA